MRGSDDPLWVDDAAPAVVTSVVLHRDLPGPAVRMASLPPTILVLLSIGLIAGRPQTPSLP